MEGGEFEGAARVKAFAAAVGINSDVDHHSAAGYGSARTPRYAVEDHVREHSHETHEMTSRSGHWPGPIRPDLSAFLRSNFAAMTLSMEHCQAAASLGATRRIRLTSRCATRAATACSLAVSMPCPPCQPCPLDDDESAAQPFSDAVAGLARPAFVAEVHDPSKDATSINAAAIKPAALSIRPPIATLNVTR